MLWVFVRQFFLCALIYLTWLLTLVDRKDPNIQESSKMQSWPICKRVARMNMKIITHIGASGKGSEPPVATPLDLVLKKASRKVKLVHPAAQTLQHGRRKDPIKQPAPHPVASRRPQNRLKTQPVDDDALFADITESERDSVWENITLAIEEDSEGDEEWLNGPGDGVLPQQRHRAAAGNHHHGPAASSRRVLNTEEHVSSSIFKGFGIPPRRGEPGPRAPTSAVSRPSSKHAPAAPVMPKSSPQPKEAVPLQAGSIGDRGSSLRLFLFNAEEARTRALLQQLGLAARVQVVDDLRCADAVVAAKLAKSGKHVNLTQGERTAANLGIPFLVVGRHMTAENLKVALRPLLDPQSEDAAGASQKQSSRRGPTRAELQAHRLEVVHGFAQMLREGSLTHAPAAGARGLEDN